MTPPPTTLAPTGRAPERAHGVELLGSLAGSGYRRAPGLVRRGDGQTVQLTPLLYALLETVDGHRRPGDLAVELGRRVQLDVTGSDVEQLLGKLRPLGLLRTADGSVQIVRKANPLLALKLKVVVTEPELTRRITTPFAALLAPWVVVPVLLAFVVTCWWVLFDKGLASATHQAFYSPGLLLAVFVLTVLSAGFHEFGHAAACRYGGATPGAMGAGLYLIWPAFYTDVDDSYRLGRWGRLRVDLGGLYFNAIAAVAFAGLGLVTGVDALLLVVATQLMQMVRQLAPFIRADGYHLLADLTGVPDLFAHIGPTLKGLLPARWGRPSATPLKVWARVVVTAWVLVMVPLLLGLLGYLVYLLPRLAATAWDSVGVQSGLLAGAVVDGDAVMIAVRMLAVVSVALPVAAISYLLVRVVRRTVRWVLRATDDRPGARLLAGLAAAFLAAVLAGAWWPSGQYQPVDAGGAGVPPAAAAPVLDPGPAAASPVVLPEDQPAEQRTTTSSRAVAAVASSSAEADGSGPSSAMSARAVAPPAAPPGPGRPTARGWVFPFDPPAGPRAFDSQALALGLTDGAVVYDVSTSWEWVTDGAVVDHRNEAYALASCQDCTTVAVAFQVVLVVGQSDVYAPVNLAGGLNYECAACTTQALAVQLVATLSEVPGSELQARLQAAWAQVQGLEGRIRGMTLDEAYALLQQVEADFLRELADAGVLAAVQDDMADTGGPTDTAAASEPVEADEATEPTDATDATDATEAGDATDAVRQEAPVADGEALEPTVDDGAATASGDTDVAPDGTTTQTTDEAAMTDANSGTESGTDSSSDSGGDDEPVALTEPDDSQARLEDEAVVTAVP